MPQFEITFRVESSQFGYAAVEAENKEEALHMGLKLISDDSPLIKWDDPVKDDVPGEVTSIDELKEAT
jgi:hypothetical protein